MGKNYEVRVEDLNQCQLDIREIHRKYGMPIPTITMPIKKGTYCISNQILLIKEAVLKGAED